MGEEERDESASDLEEPLNKKQRQNYGQISIQNFYKSKKLEKGYSDAQLPKLLL